MLVSDLMENRSGKLLMSEDFTPRWAVERTRMAYGQDTVDYIMQRRWQILKYCLYVLQCIFH